MVKFLTLSKDATLNVFEQRFGGNHVCAAASTLLACLARRRYSMNPSFAGFDEPRRQGLSRRARSLAHWRGSMSHGGRV